MPTLAVAGTWRADVESEIYRFAESVAALFASRGWDIVTGGYSGVMDAGLKGARNYATAARALTWTALDGVLPTSAYAKEEIRFESIARRAGALVGDAQAVLVMPGRTGTVAELALAVEARAKGQLNLPVMVYGNHWDDFFDWLKASNSRLGLPRDPQIEDPENLFRRVFTVEDARSMLTQAKS